MHNCNKIFRLFLRARIVFYSRFNKFLFWISGVDYGKNLHVMNKIYLHVEKNASILIGDDFTMTSGDSINPLSRNKRGAIYCESGGKILIGNNVGMASPCIWAKTSVTVGDNVNVGADCIILDTDCHSLDYEIRKSRKMAENGKTLDSALAKSKPIIIEDDVLIGTRCIILKGVTIGARSIVAAGSVVSRSVPEDCVAAGNPAKVVKTIRK